MALGVAGFRACGASRFSGLGILRFETSGLRMRPPKMDLLTPHLHRVQYPTLQTATVYTAAKHGDRVSRVGHTGCRV